MGKVCFQYSAGYRKREVEGRRGERRRETGQKEKRGEEEQEM